MERRPFIPTADEWEGQFDMLCMYCRHSPGCQIVEAMIEAKDGGSWPEGGWVTDPGAGMTCLSYEPRPMQPLPRQQRRRIERMKESALPPVCGGCAARKGSDASVSLHTQRDYRAAVATPAKFVCHEDPNHQQLCGGWCRAIQRKAKR
jgi:hypothetical protein